MSLGENAISLAERLVDPLGPIEGVPGGQMPPCPTPVSLFTTQLNEGAQHLVKKLPKLFVLQIVQFSEKISVWAQFFLYEVYPTCVFICKAGGSRMSKIIFLSVQCTNTEIEIH